MIRYLAHRLLLALPTLLGVAVLIFIMLRVVPGDIVELKLRGEGGNVTQDVVERERARLGLDKPIAAQFADWMVGLVTLDFGKSMWTERPVVDEIGLRFKLSFELALLAMLIAVAVALPLGTVSALLRDTWIDYIVRFISVAGLAMPAFWLGMLIILALLHFFNWLPPITFTPLWQDPAANLAQLVWPALAVGYRYSAVATRMTRSTLLEVMREDYIRTARAKGVFERLVVARHAMRNALLPTTTVVGLEFAFLVGGLVVTEQVFNLNGIGKLFVEATSRGDYTMIQALVMLVAAFFILVNFTVDL
ncbi:MAG TPA: ABC transporter permease, partial [Stellaceae bacterium]|nr:ABC transporter permease [Stellaceae bacterium]